MRISYETLNSRLQSRLQYLRDLLRHFRTNSKQNYCTYTLLYNIIDQHVLKRNMLHIYYLLGKSNVLQCARNKV